MKKININNLYKKIRKKIWVLPTTLMLLSTKVFAEGSISTAEVTQATENIKNAVIKLAIPIRWHISIC